MIDKKNWLFSLVAVPSLLATTCMPVPSSATTFPDLAHFTCRASALHADQLLGSTFKPVVANGPEDPCKTDNKVLLDVRLGSLLSLGSIATVLGAVTEDTSAPITSEPFAVGVSILDLVKVRVLESSANVKSVNEQCVLSSESSVALVVAGGQSFDLIKTPLGIPISGIDILHFNKELKPNP